MMEDCTNFVRLMNIINFDTDSNKTYLAEEKHGDSYGKAQWSSVGRVIAVPV